MEMSTITIIITMIAILLFAIDKIPVSFTALFIIIALTVTGVLAPSESFAGLSNSSVLLLIGLMIIGRAVFTTGIADKIGEFLIRSVGNDHESERKLIIILFIVSAVLGMFVLPLAVVTVFMAVIDIISSKSDGRITRKMTYLPMAIGATYGGQLTAISASSMIMASSLLEITSVGRGFTFFEPFLITIGGLILPVLFYLTIGYKMQLKWFDFPEVPLETPETTNVQKEYTPWKMVVVVITLALCIIGFITKVANSGLIAMIGAAVVIVTGCIKEGDAFRCVSWPTIFVVVGSLALAKALETTGAGMIVSNLILKAFGPLGNSAFGMCIVMLSITTILSALMSDAATVGITAPFAIAIASTLGVNPIPFLLVCARGANIPVLTPISVISVTVTLPAGYRFKDFFRLGGSFTLGSYITTLVAIYLIYFI